MFSAVKSNNLSGLEGILGTGLDVFKFNFVNVKNAQNTSPIHFAAWKGYGKVVRILLKHEANPNSRSKNDLTPLHYASKFSHFGIVKDLLRHGAIFEAVSDSDKTPLQYSTNQDIFKILEFLKKIFCKIENKDCTSLQDLKAIEDMDIAKAVLRAKNIQGRTLITVAVVNDHPKTDELKEIFQTGVLIPLKMAEMFYNHGNFEESLKSYKLVLQKRNSIFSQDDPAVLDIQERLVALLVHIQDYNGALSLAQNVYETLRNIVGDRKRGTLRVKGLLALIFDRIGQEEEAIKIYQEVSEKQIKVLGLNHKETLLTLTSMAELLYKANKFEMAMKVNEDILKTLIKRHEIDPWILRIQTNIAKILRKQEKYSEALERFESISEAKEKIFGLHHRESMATTTEYAATFFLMGKEEKSLELLRKNVDLQLNLLGPNYPDTLHTRSVIADILFLQKKFLVALSLYTKDLFAGVSKLGVYHPSNELARERIDFINSYMENPSL